MSEITITNEDNMVLMARYPDKYFDLAIVDPPYGINVNMNAGLRKGEKKRYVKKDWDKGIPTAEYFKELQRVSKNQIVWGCNYFDGLLWSCGRISWFKNVGSDNDYSDCELAMSSFNNKVTYVKIDWSGFIMPENERGTKRIHPTQKPINLYKWILDKYAKEGDKILDTHLGSGSIAIACHDYKFDLTACELDKEYFDAAMKRLNDHRKQTSLF
jgi:site-specific DNA-methyltransferase (adenine-specific)